MFPFSWVIYSNYNACTQSIPTFILFFSISLSYPHTHTHTHEWTSIFYQNICREAWKKSVWKHNKNNTNKHKQNFPNRDFSDSVKHTKPENILLKRTAPKI